MLEANVEMGKVQAALANMALRMRAGVRKALVETGAAHQKAMAERFKPFGSGGPIQTRSGALRRSFGYAIRGEAFDSELTMFSAGLPYARIQEYGGTIRPKRKRYLTIPLSDALTPAGVLKGGARLVVNGPRHETADGAPTFIFRSKRGALLIASRTGDGRMRLLYKLQKQVDIAPRLGFRSTFERFTVPFMNARLARTAQEAVKQ